ncbi:hypothetical protein [Streptomyces colonosanans]|nr:hypothetical protein [Streptomyces colonosanans]
MNRPTITAVTSRLARCGDTTVLQSGYPLQALGLLRRLGLKELVEC